MLILKKLSLTVTRISCRSLIFYFVAVNSNIVIKFDVKATFLHGEIKEEIFMQIRQTYSNLEKYVSCGL